MGASFIFETKHGLVLALKSEAPKQYAYFQFSTGYQPPPSGKVHTVAAHTTAALASALAASSVGDTIAFPDKGIYPLPTNFVFPEGRTYVAKGIYDQNGGASGTWLQGTGIITWGASVTLGTSLSTGFLLGKSGALMRPSSRGASGSPAGSDTHTNGAHDCAFNGVRFMGGGVSLLDLSNNYTNTWASVVQKCDMIHHVWTDCEFEAPLGGSSTTSGGLFNIWWDQRSGGSQVHDLLFNRCHLGVKNANGVTGIARSLLFQPTPSASSSGNGPTKAGGSVVTPANINASFNWAQVDHGAYNVAFVDCLHEAPGCNWSPQTHGYAMDICDSARAYSTWQGSKLGYADSGLSIGWGNPPGSHWVDIPTANWSDNFDFTRCYAKGGSTVFEMGRNCTVLNCGGISVGHAGSYGNTQSGSFSNSNRPHTALFPADWVGSYNASPYDPA